MLFNSIEFLVFFGLLTTLYFIVPHRFRWFLLLTASVIFYMSLIPVYIFVLAFLILVDYIAGIFIEKNKGNKRKPFLLISIIATCSALFFFKYFNFFGSNLTELAKLIGWNYSIGALSIILPIGLSFHTFQSLSYVIEVYRGKQKAERNIGIYALYVMFYPQLVAGPIERPQNLLHQFREKHNFDYKNVIEGLRLMLWGLFMKIVIADRLAILVNTVYANPTDYTGIPLILGTLFFGFQIFCDFAGYSTIAIGAARVMGFRLMKNFNRPYFSSSVSEFWRRWHISLSTWFRDYLYIPLGGSKKGRPRWHINIPIVFLISGLWHGASWTFVIWGALHGLYILITAMTQKPRNKIISLVKLNKSPKIYKFLSIAITFCLVTFAWIFFRANSVSDAVYISTHLFSGIKFDFSGLRVGLGWQEIFVSFGLILFMEITHLVQSQINLMESFSRRKTILKWGCYIALILAIIFLGHASEKFIYFQF